MTSLAKFFPAGCALAFAAALCAAEPAGEAPVINPALAAEYRQGDSQLAFYGGYIHSIHGSQHFAYGAAALEYFAWDDIGLFAEGVGYNFSPRDDGDSPGEGFNIGARWHFLKVDRCAFYIEGLVGILQSNARDFPAGGTQFNFTEQAGVGLKYRLTDHVSLIGGSRYAHISNADKNGDANNPGFDGFGGYAGFTIRF
jgi:opacity protein-like surface antigen